MKEKQLETAVIKRHRLLLAILVVFLAVALVAAGGVIYGMREGTLHGAANRYPYIDPARSFIPQEDFIVNVQPLRVDIRQLAREFGEESVSIYIEYLNTGANIAINPETYIWPASLVKVPLAMAVMKKVEDGSWSLSNELVLMAADKNDRSGATGESLWEYPIGTRFTIEQLLKELLVNSDNTAFNVLYRNLHVDEIQNVVNDLGIEALFTKEGKVSAKEYSRLFRSLYNASFLSREDSERILEWLDESPFDEFLSRDIPDEIRFPHKYGENVDYHAYTDSGIVYVANRPYLITVMVAGDPEIPWQDDKAKAAAFMGEISKKTYDYFLQY